MMTTERITRWERFINDIQPICQKFLFVNEKREKEKIEQGIQPMSISDFAKSELNKLHQADFCVKKELYINRSEMVKSDSKTLNKGWCD